MSKDDRIEREDIRHSFILCCMTVCVVVITGASVCLNTYIQAVYQLKLSDAQNLRYQ